MYTSVSVPRVIRTDIRSGIGHDADTDAELLKCSDIWFYRVRRQAEAKTHTDKNPKSKERTKFRRSANQSSRCHSD